MTPFADDKSGAVGGMTVENGPDKVVLYGSLELTRDKAGLEHAQALRTMLDAVIQALQADPALPAALPPPERPRRVRNPFGPA